MSLSVVLVLLVFGVMFATVAVWIGRTGAFRIAPSPVFAVLGVWFLYIVGDTVVGRLLIETDGTVVARQPVNNPRPGTFYTMQAADGQAYEFASGASDVSLARDFAVGSHITKRKWDLGYTVDGRRVDDFETTFYSGWAVAGVFLIWYSLLPYLTRTTPNQAMRQ
jgi:hypothetical protein